MKRLKKAVYFMIVAAMAVVMCSCGSNKDVNEEASNLLNQIEQLGDKTLSSVGLKNGRYSLSDTGFSITRVTVNKDSMEIHNTGESNPDDRGEHNVVVFAKEIKSYSSGVKVYSLSTVECEREYTSLSELKKAVANDSTGSAEIKEDVYTLKVLGNDKFTLNDFEFNLVKEQKSNKSGEGADEVTNTDSPAVEEGSPDATGITEDGVEAHGDEGIVSGEGNAEELTDNADGTGSTDSTSGTSSDSVSIDTNADIVEEGDVIE